MKKGVDYIGVSVSHICHDGKGNILMTKRGIKCRDEHGTWDLGAGGLEFGETAEECLKRELREEYDVAPVDYRFLGYLDLLRNLDGVKTHWIALTFLVQLDSVKVKNNEPDKFEDVGWFKANNLPKPLHSAALIVLEKYKDWLPNA